MTMKNRKTLAAVAVLLALALVFVAPVSAEDTETGVSCEGTSCTHVAAVTVDGTATHYNTLAAAINAAETASSEKQIEVDLLVDVNGDSEAAQGISIASNSNILIDFNNHYYNGTTPLAGSEGTKSQVFQLLKDSTIVMKNGTIKSKDAAMLIMNYADLTLQNMVLDGRELAVGYVYNSQNTVQLSLVLSNNNGNVVIDSTTIYEATGEGHTAGTAAFDVDYRGDSTYPTLHVTVKGTSNIVGDIVADNPADVNDANKYTFTINGGTFSSDVSDYVAAGYTCTENADESTWTVGQKPLTIIYNDGLENGKTMTQTIEDDAETVDLTEETFTCEGATFLGWNATSVDGTDVDYAYAQKDISVDSLDFGEDRELTLYAVWVPVVTEEIEIEATVNEATGNTTATFNDAEVISEIDPKLQFENTTWIEYGNAIIGIIFTNAADNETFASDPTSLDAPIMGALALTGGLSSNTDNVYYSEYYVWLSMNNLTSIPEIDGTFNETIVALPELAELDEVITMISAEADNTNLTEVSVVFAVSKADGDVMSNFVGYHVSGTTVTQLTGEKFKIEDDTETNSWIITLTGTGFSSYVVGYETPASTGGDSGSGSSSGSGSGSGNGSSNGSSSSGSTSGTTTGTPDVPPTEEPTDEPTDVPGEDLPDIPDVPVTPEEPSTPAPILAVLAGLGAAVVLRRK